MFQHEVVSGVDVARLGVCYGNKKSYIHTFIEMFFCLSADYWHWPVWGI